MRSLSLSHEVRPITNYKSIHKAISQVICTPFTFTSHLNPSSLEYLLSSHRMRCNSLRSSNQRGRVRIHPYGHTDTVLRVRTTKH